MPTRSSSIALHTTRNETEWPHAQDGVPRTPQSMSNRAYNNVVLAETAFKVCLAGTDPRVISTGRT